jgi:hypothetical protein
MIKVNSKFPIKITVFINAGRIALNNIKNLTTLKKTFDMQKVLD